MAILINARWVDIPEDAIFNQLRRLGIKDWGIRMLLVAGHLRHYLFSGQQYAYPYSLPLEVIDRLARRLNEVEDMTWYRKYNQIAMDYFNEYGFALNEAFEYWLGVGNPALPEPKIKPVDGLNDGDEYIAIIGLFHLPGSENNNNSHLFIDLIDEIGNRIYNHSPPLFLWYKWDGITDDEVNRLDPVRIDKPLNEPGANIGITWDQIIYGFHINNVATDRFSGIHTRYESDGPGNDWGYHSHYIVLQKRVFRSPGPGQPPPPDPEPEPEPQPDPGQPKIQISLTVNYAWVKAQIPDESGNITIEGELN